MEYNTSRNYLNMVEYGRHVQKMVQHTKTITDTILRQKNAEAIIEVMGSINPHLKNVEDFRHMLWDHLFFISNFELDIKSPYPIPTKETYKVKPDPMGYPKRKPKYRHLGKHLELIIDKALNEQNPEKKLGFSNTVAYYMKLSYSNWHKELVADETIRAELTSLTNGQLDFTTTPYVQHRNENARDPRANANFRRNNNNPNFKGNNNRNNGPQNGNRPNNNANNNANSNANGERRAFVPNGTNPNKKYQKNKF